MVYLGHLSQVTIKLFGYVLDNILSSKQGKCLPYRGLKSGCGVSHKQKALISSFGFTNSNLKQKKYDNLDSGNYNGN